jgi:hypothetical protein
MLLCPTVLVNYDASALAVLPTMAWLWRFHLSTENSQATMHRLSAQLFISAVADFFFFLTLAGVRADFADLLFILIHRIP